MTSLRKINIKKVKSAMERQFPNSSASSFLQTLPDQIEPPELIGAIGILLEISDRESNKNLNNKIIIRRAKK